MRRPAPRLVLLAGAVVAAGFAAVGSAANEDKVFICHGTASEPRPYVLIEVDSSALNGHFDGTAPGHGAKNHPDIYPVPAGGCPTVPPGGEGGEE
jgi:hypothetical protein